MAYYIVPNYSDYPCAYFFAFQERSQGVFTHKPPALYEQYLQIKKKFVVVSNTEQDNFCHAFTQHIPADGKPDVLFLAAKDFDGGSIMGGIMKCPRVRQVVLDFVKTSSET